MESEGLREMPLSFCCDISVTDHWKYGFLGCTNGDGIM